MSIYISKNNQQTGPFDDAKVLEMLNSGQLSPDDFAIRQGSTQWQKLGELFPEAGRNAQAAQPTFAQAAAGQTQGAPAFNQPQATPTKPQATPKKSRKGLLIGCLGILLLGGSVLAVLGFLGWRNLNPPDSTENLPDKVKDFKLDQRYPPKGDIWGTKSEFVGIYKDGTDQIIYLMTVYANETAAKDAMRSELAKTCKAGETPMNFSFMKDGKEVSQGATCAVPLYVQKDNKLVTLGGGGADAGTFIEFAENLPFNNGAEMKKKE